MSEGTISRWERLADRWGELQVVIYRESGDALYLQLAIDQARRLGMTPNADQEGILPSGEKSITLSALAERWRCPEWHISTMLSRGLLRHFRVGKKVVRIRLSDVESLEELDQGPETVLQHLRFLRADTATGESPADPKHREPSFPGKIREGSREYRVALGRCAPVEMATEAPQPATKLTALSGDRLLPENI